VDRRILLVVVVALLAACSEQGGADMTNARTEAERDSLIGESSLPGAQGVKAARRAADAAEERAATLDSITQ
jgi:hypothetical protein